MSVQTTTQPTAKRFPRVRVAVPEDFAGIMTLCRQLYAENGAVNVDWPSVENTVMDGVNGHQSCLGVIGKPEQLEGMIYLRISRMWYSSDIILEELFNFVGAEFRRSHNAKALLEFAKTNADRLEVPLLIGVISNAKTAAKIRLYSRYLGAPAGAFFLYGAHTGGR